MDIPVVNTPPVTPAAPTVEAPVVPGVTPASPQTPVPGSHTDPALLLKSLQEERQRRQELEAQLADMTPVPSGNSEVYSDEGLALKREIDAANARVNSLLEERELDKLYGQFPALKDKSAEFDEFRKDFPRHKLENVAKIYLSEKGLLESAPTRVGLESPSGGARTPASPNQTAEDVRRLRETNPRKYTQMLKEGKISI